MGVAVRLGSARFGSARLGFSGRIFAASFPTESLGIRLAVATIIKSY